MPEQRHRARLYGSPIPGVYASDIDSAVHFGRHAHDDFGFGFLLSGAQRWFSGRGTVRGYPGQVISTNPGEVHDGAPIGGEARRWGIIHVPAPTMSELLGADGEASIRQPVIDDPELVKMLSRTFVLLKEKASPLLCEELLVASCNLLMRRHGTRFVPPQPPPSDLRAVRERLADSSAAAPSLADLASIAGLSRYQVLRRFQRTFGLSPHAWSVQLRVERARACIRRGDSLSMAAAFAGFADQSHMNRHFIRQLGFTPGRYREAVLQ